MWCVFACFAEDNNAQAVLAPKKPTPRKGYTSASTAAYRKPKNVAIVISSSDDDDTDFDERNVVEVKTARDTGDHGDGSVMVTVTNDDKEKYLALVCNYL